MAERTLEAAQQLLATNTNASGGSEKYREHCGKLRKSLRDLPTEWSAACRHAEHLLAAMDHRCVSKTPGTWRPFVVLLIKLLKPSEEQLTAALKVAGKSASTEALLIAEEEARAAAEGKRVVLDKKRPLALQTCASSDKGLSQSSQTSTLALALPCNDLEQRLAERSSQGIQRFFGKRRKIEEDSPGASPAAATASAAGKSQAASEEQPASAASTSGHGNTQPMVEEAQAEQPPADGEEPQSSTEGGAPANQDAETSAAADPKGYYAQLCLAPGAAPGDIRAAYKKMILVCHPDKGGRAQDFRAVVEAYSVLSDLDKRKTYDGHETFDAMTTAPAAAKSPADKGQLAKDVFARMLLTREAEWERLLQGVDDSVVEVLSGELQVISADGGRGESAEKKNSGYSEYSAPGLKQRKNKTWWVQIGWRNFKISADRIACMKRAVDLHDALVQTRNTAMARYRTAMADLKKLKCSDMSGAALDSSIPVLTQSELALLLQEEPYIPLHFASDLDNPRIQTAWTPAFNSATEFRMWVRQVQSQEGNIKDLKAMMSKRAAEDRKERNDLTQRAAVLLKRITEVRQQERLQRSSTALGAETPPLALKEVANAEELMKAMKDMEARLEEAWERRIQAMDQQYQQQMQKHMEDKQELLKEKQRQEMRLLEERHRHSEVLEEQQRHLEELRLREERQRHEEERLLEEKQRHIEERRQEEIQRLEEQLMEERMRSQISEQVAQRLENSLQARAQPRPNLFARKHSLFMDMPHDDSSRWMPEALRACNRSISRNFPPTALEPAGSYGHRRQRRIGVDSM